jgi:hypothetical protein
MGWGRNSQYDTKSLWILQAGGTLKEEMYKPFLDLRRKGIKVIPFTSYLQKMWIDLDKGLPLSSVSTVQISYAEPWVILDISEKKSWVLPNIRTTYSVLSIKKRHPIQERK